MAKKFTATEFEKLSTQLDKTTKIKIVDNKYEVELDATFRESKIDNVVMKYYGVLQELRTVESPDAETVKNTVYLLNTFILKEFTDLPIPNELSIGELIQVTHNLLDLGIMVEVMNSIPKSEFDKIETKLRSSADNLMRMATEIPVQVTGEVIEDVQ